MNRSPAPAARTRPRRTSAALVKALGALCAFAVTLGALPWLLWHATAAIASGGLDAARHLFDRQDTGALALLAVCVIGWLALGSFVLSVLLEIPAQLRGVRAPQLPGLQISQRAAAVLVGSLLVLLPTGTALAASPAQAAPRTVASASAETEPGSAVAVQQSTQSHSEQAPQNGHHDTYTVRDTRPAESLWSIAERLYGHGDAFTHLVDANEGRTMVDGRTFHADAPIYPGWVLQLPADVPRLDTVASPAGADGHNGEGLQPQGETAQDQAHVVKPGDTITGIAQDETGDAANWRAVYEASRGAQPDGLPRITDPDLIVPEQRVTIPAELQSAPHTSNEHEERHDRSPEQERDKDQQDAAPDEANEEASPPAQETERPSDTAAPQSPDAEGEQGDPAGAGTHGRPSNPPTVPATPSAPGHRSSTPAERPSASATPTSPAAEQPRNSAAAEPAAPATTAPQSGQQQENAHGSPIRTRTGLQAFALLAGVITTALLARRLWQWRTRRPGQQAPATEPVPVEDVLETAAHDGAHGVERLQTALRLLTQLPDGEAPPALRAARITADSVHVLPDDVTAEAQAPFTGTRAGWWVLPHTVDLPAPAETKTDEPPYAAMVTLGATPSGELLLADLTAWQVLLVDGSRQERAEVMAAMATELAIGPCADFVEVYTCGMGSLASDLRTMGVQYLADPRLAAGEFAHRVLEAHQDPEARGFPYIVLCAAEAEDDILWQLAESLSRAEGLTPCALVLPAEAASVFPDAEMLDASTDGPQRIDAVGDDITLQRLDAVSITELARACAQAEQPPDDPQGVWEHVPPEPVAVPGPPVRPVPAAPSLADTEHGDTQSAAPSPDGEGQPEPTAVTAGQPLVFQALLASSDPGQTDLRPVPPAEEQTKASPAIGPRFRIPVVHALTAPERVAPIPETDEDRAVTEAGQHHEAPRLRVLGNLAMDNLLKGPAGPRLVELTAHLLLKPGSSADRLCEDLGDDEPWSPRTLSARLRDLRTALGSDPDGTPYVPQRTGKTSPYAVSDKVQCDWHDFQRLSELGLSRGADGLPYLERALALVDGVPLNGHPAKWMTGVRTRMQADITNVAHTVASYRTQDGPHQDLPSARTACRTGLTVDSYCEWLHRDLMRAEAAAGNHTGLRAAIATWREMTSSLPPGQIDRATMALVDELLDAS
ncbi:MULTISPECIES: BTAD domain-containing putative transcriptional regulator [unclassified Streptomyces]|uniref:BTAD domain-containing putative transcriptional regulator n=1 Tax=unclassified Streptomyces TaxID=2593676 RepID=UPI000DC59F6C|nr:MULTISPECIES: BTAD domain-containing putative transcriptional regulator [unclassified Streptomyces]MYT68328.1 LysM peptidoglycan-binding domain-containing protein [Streptomyces sp. SID8367]RAJ76964.1 transcriptional activator [Streptomyces sp. PsTaAH-137]